MLYFKFLYVLHDFIKYFSPKLKAQNNETQLVKKNDKQMYRKVQRQAYMDR